MCCREKFKNFLTLEDIKRYKCFKMVAALLYFFLIWALPWVLNLLSADFVPERKFIFAVILGFLFANVRTVLKLEYIWDEKKVRTIKGLLPVYLINYLVTVPVICIVGSYFLMKVRNLPDVISLVILFCLGFGVDSIFDLLTHAGDLFQIKKSL